jgi:hypothetical protein
MSKTEQVKYFKNRINESTDKEELKIILEFMEENVQKFSMKDINTIVNKLNTILI